MDWKIFATTFGLIFLAELGDKTQLASISMVTKTKAPLAVFLGSVAAYCIVTLLGVTIGVALTKFIPPRTIHILAGIAFVILGIFIIFDVF